MKQLSTSDALRRARIFCLFLFVFAFMPRAAWAQVRGGSTIGTAFDTLLGVFFSEIFAAVAVIAFICTGLMWFAGHRKGGDMLGRAVIGLGLIASASTLGSLFAF